ncbi:MAG: dehypoxanthine futalosine cyclase [Deltaproteobacteria bacterium]|nr:dehypoxanthine futalosine cyclase [Deltaproteobacteria bacterium]
MTLEKLYEKINDGGRIDEDEALRLLLEAGLLELGRLAQKRAALRHDPCRATFLIDRNINYTNICTSKCRFCAFYRDKDAPDAYVLSPDAILEKVAEAVQLGATQIMLQGGLNPGLGLSWFEDVLQRIKQRFTIFVHSFSPPEIHHLAKKEQLSCEEVIVRLRDAGLDSIPGAGAEILTDGVRARISPEKISGSTWLDVMEAAHRVGLKTTATMMMGSVETPHDRIEHLRLLRGLQDKTGGFRAFIPWTFKAGNTELGGAETSSLDYLRTLALSRIYLDNIDNIQGSWVTQGKDIGQMTLFFGANDLGSIMLEENVVSAAGSSNCITEAEMVELIRHAGKQPAQRDTEYRIVKTYPELSDFTKND